MGVSGTHQTHMGGKAAQCAGEDDAIVGGKRNPLTEWRNVGKENEVTPSQGAR